YSWTGNIRELENAIERAYNLIDGNVIKLKHLPEKIVSNNRPLCVGSLNKTLNEIEKQRIIDALKASGGNKSKAAKMLGINRAGLYQKLKKHGINYF
ncbi:MAG: sigma-54 dependent transcriptional regulator, acetoin dehydrogenase operon transcriptional, partial [Clostridiales bacterium]|nr:sigma-54 dependent transcriptional regulator, acetoin dehydrogenase operon transcriptional [Clostridiales bacterium]